MNNSPWLGNWRQATHSRCRGGICRLFGSRISWLANRGVFPRLWLKTFKAFWTHASRCLRPAGRRIRMPTIKKHKPTAFEATLWGSHTINAPYMSGCLPKETAAPCALFRPNAIGGSSVTLHDNGWPPVAAPLLTTSYKLHLTAAVSYRYSTFSTSTKS